LVDSPDLLPPYTVLRHPHKDENSQENSQVEQKAGYGSLHPMGKIGDWQHGERNNGEIDARLFGYAPFFMFASLSTFFR
jgi:hypothetical protein